MTLELMFVGDLMLSAPEPSRYFDHVRDHLRRADVAIGHLEWPHTDRGQVCVTSVPAPANPVSYLDAVAECGFAVMTMASNHMFDQGPFGVADSIDGLRSRNILPVGAGMTIEEARRPAILERDGLRLGFLSYNAVGPRESWATEAKAGVAPVRVHSHYELEIASPGSAPTEYTRVDEDSADALVADIQALRENVDILAVSFHKGMGFVHARLAQYERPLTQMAIDAGADIVIGHHAHILRGVEVYRGKPIYHGINHFVPAYTPQTDPLGGHRAHPKRAPLGFTPDPGAAPFPFPRDARHTMIARVVVDDGGVRQAGFVPCYLGSDARPVPHGDDEVGRSVGEYVQRISSDAGLDVRLRWEKDVVNFLPEECGDSDGA